MHSLPGTAERVANKTDEAAERLDPAKPYRDQALRSIGRNIVNFQRLETALKLLIPRVNIAGPMKDIAGLQAAKQKALKRLSLGTLTDRLRDEVMQVDGVAVEATPETGIVVSHTFAVADSPAETESFLKHLALLVRERNRLVHTDFSSITFDSINECKALSERLDEQNQRICAQLDFLKEALLTHADATAALARFMESDECAQMLGLPRNSEAP